MAFTEIVGLRDRGTRERTGKLGVVSSFELVVEVAESHPVALQNKGPTPILHHLTRRLHELVGIDPVKFRSHGMAVGRIHVLADN